MPTILALDTSGVLCSVALHHEGRRFVESRPVQKQHNLFILGMIGQLCRQAGIVPLEFEGIAFLKGPGSFTGVRLAAAVAQGLACGSQAKILGLTSSQALALHAGRLGAAECITAVRSRADAYYLAAFNRDAAGALTQTVDDVLAHGAPAWFGSYTNILGDMPAWASPPLQLLPADQHPAATLVDHAVAMWGQSCWGTADMALPLYIEGDHPWKPSVPV
jgi:tRNA threonylcarbamoyladenosine biosynthesis protein TsaB